MKNVFYLICIIGVILVCDKINAYTEYKVGDEVKYNNVDYYVIKDSSSNDGSVTMLKAEPLTVEEVNLYGGVGTANNHVNMYVTSDTTSSYYQTAYNINGYGGMAYYTSETCGTINSNYVETGCKNDYASSDVKYVVDAWKTAEAPAASEARLISYDELTDNLGYEKKNVGTIYPSSSGTTPSWVYNSSYWYWTMSPYDDSMSNVWIVDSVGNVNGNGVYYYNFAVRPVIVLSKTELGDEDESVIDDKEEIDDKENKMDIENNKNDNTSKEVKVEKSDNKVSSEVKVANTYMSKSITIIAVGFIVSVLSILIFYKYVNKKV